ncbi:MAG: hypothetical protein DWQ42_10890 [Planctomycetota bacterium]|nr:MAG: hypothetical protein DWQ42_10890 [Planctomycetota bacterium]REK46504.1 MAG: hypothetical protein DWQ46_06415 [Planctomycetota bacterium]
MLPFESPTPDDDRNALGGAAKRQRLHSCDLVRVAAAVAENAAELLHEKDPATEPNMRIYWTAATDRFRRWTLAFAHLEKVAQRLADGRLQTMERSQAGVVAETLLEEIFWSETLTRVWTAALVARDRLRGDSIAGPLVKSILCRHQEQSHRGLQLIASSKLLDWPRAVELNRLRRRAERWSDVLIARLAGVCRSRFAEDILPLAVDRERARDFAVDTNNDLERSGNTGFAWELTMASLHSVLDRRVSSTTPNGALNFQIAWHVVSCFEPTTFDATGPFQPLWLERLVARTDEAQDLVDEYLTHLG